MSSKYLAWKGMKTGDFVWACKVSLKGYNLMTMKPTKGILSTGDTLVNLHCLLLQRVQCLYNMQEILLNRIQLIEIKPFTSLFRVLKNQVIYRERFIPINLTGFFYRNEFFYLCPNRTRTHPVREKYKGTKGITLFVPIVDGKPLWSAAKSTLFYLFGETEEECREVYKNLLANLSENVNKKITGMIESLCPGENHLRIPTGGEHIILHGYPGTFIPCFFFGFIAQFFCYGGKVGFSCRTWTVKAYGCRKCAPIRPLKDILNGAILNGGVLAYLGSCIQE